MISPVMGVLSALHLLIWVPVPGTWGCQVLRLCANFDWTIPHDTCTIYSPLDWFYGNHSVYIHTSFCVWCSLCLTWHGSSDGVLSSNQMHSHHALCVPWVVLPFFPCLSSRIIGCRVKLFFKLHLSRTSWVMQQYINTSVSALTGSVPCHKMAQGCREFRHWS